MTTTQIMNLVENELGYNISGKTRARQVVYGRAIYFKICKDRTNLSLQEIGETLNLHHATVLHSIRNVFPAFEMYNPEYMEIYNRIIKAEEYIPADKQLARLKIQHYQLELKYDYVKNLNIDIKHRTLLSKIKEIPDLKLQEAEKRIDRLVERLK
jgi:hypothetical protein|tara:strand:+ start:62 stop:526 length:465 start_codon:yes stop_codon:yes gene_type:complete